jgi:FAD/FMN-containing dehydrogenase/Fe-S oxidoreductase
MPDLLIAEPDEALRRLQEELTRRGFTGDFETSLGARQVASTDNSIYEVRPAAIAYPACGGDISRLIAAVRACPGVPLSLTARGGGTGTNGQSLNDGVIVDFARHMNHILAIDPIARTARVEPGVVLDQLNEALASHGLFFPPNVSTASRATIGGMTATDASGKGSRRYGKTSDYIVGIDLILADGTPWHACTMPRVEAERIASQQGIVGDIHRAVLDVTGHFAEEIASVFPKMNRGLTGYNLQKTKDVIADTISLPYLLAGSEGTLALTEAITLRVVPKPTHTILVVARYAAFHSALKDVGRLLAADPVAIEILDDKVLSVAQSDVLWGRISAVLGDAGREPVRGLNFIEFSGFSLGELTDPVATIETLLTTPGHGVVDHVIVRDRDTIGLLWALREKAVGLLGKLGQTKQGTPFVEDTAVPPERLPAYVAEFRALLDGYGLQYGMFGHADVGCLHVRPFLDMKDPAQAALIRPISDAVATLTKQHGGLLWGEHGRGYRGEYSPLFFGPTLYPALRRIKAAFDPDGRLNPGKLAAVDGGRPIDRIDAIPIRGEQDRLIDSVIGDGFERAIACNGNGACFSWDANDPLCPSYKATRDRAQSPKGRAALLRAWARLESDSRASPTERAVIERELVNSLDTCLSCKACTSLCPVRVDIPTMRSRFFSRYYKRRFRPLRHMFLANMESLLGVGRRLPWMTNAVLQSSLGRRLVQQRLGLMDLPPFVDTPKPVANNLLASLNAVSLEERSRLIVLVEDSFISTFEPEIVEAAGHVLETLGYRVHRKPPASNGKVLHVLGMEERFATVARARMNELTAIAATGASLIGLDAATMLMAEQEYAIFSEKPVTVRGLDDFLATELASGAIRVPPHVPSGKTYRLFGHCTETALRPRALEHWCSVFAAFGIEAQAIRTGCCGMAGLFGHETKHSDLSRNLFDLSWRPAFAGAVRVREKCRPPPSGPV